MDSRRYVTIPFKWSLLVKRQDDAIAFARGTFQLKKSQNETQLFHSTLENYTNDEMPSYHLFSLFFSLLQQQFCQVSFLAPTHKYISPVIPIMAIPCDQLFYLSELLSLVPCMMQHAPQAANLEFILVLQMPIDDMP